MTMVEVQDKGKVHRDKLKTFQMYTLEDLKNRLLSQEKMQHAREFCSKAVNGNLIHSSLLQILEDRCGDGKICTTLNFSYRT